MPPGIPVGCMAIGKAGAKNAALFALEILGVTDRKIMDKLSTYRKEMKAKIRRIKIKA
jgi:5-(carboxyamino)imidazole ribonucleotide mutase